MIDPSCQCCWFARSRDEEPRIECHRRSPRSRFGWPVVKATDWCGQFEVNFAFMRANPDLFQ